MAGLEDAAQRVLAAGLSTGHADSWDQLLDEVIDQALDYRGRLMAAAADELTAQAQELDMGYGKPEGGEG